MVILNPLQLTVEISPTGSSVRQVLCSLLFLNTLLFPLFNYPVLSGDCLLAAVIILFEIIFTHQKIHLKGALL